MRNNSSTGVSQISSLSNMASQNFALQLSSSTQLDIIDKLRDLGIGDHIALPQLVVVGDQSSGKSSVLEAFSGLPFARDSGLCTRFATQITMRRTTTESISVSVIPHNEVPAEEVQKFKDFKKDGLTSLTGDSFLKIFQEACEVMGVSSVAGPPAVGQSTFSKNVLKVELSGPTRENLSIIDIPGIFRTPTPGVTTKADMLLVDEMVRNYIRDDRTIILAVLPANVDIATQGILTMAEEVDPNGVRTLGVLTKPDLVDDGAEKNIIDLVEGKSGMKLRLGYCIVRNRGQKDLSSDSNERVLKEKEFFTKKPWSSIDKDRVGVDALKQRLQELLESITRKALPTVKKEIDRQLKVARHRLNGLGADRDASDLQRIYLQEMAIKFQKITDSALDTYYERDDVFTKYTALRLPTLVVDRSEVFAKTIWKNGHTVTFQEAEDDKDGEMYDESAVPAHPVDEVGHTVYKRLDEYPILEEILPTKWVCDSAYTGDALKWIEVEYRRCRGVGLADIGPAVLPTLWSQQSKKWERIALEYVSDIILFVHHYIHTLLIYVCPDERTRHGIISILDDLVMEKYKLALKQARFVVQVERSGTPLTHNHYFNDTLQRLRNGRMRKDIKNHAQEAIVRNGSRYETMVPISALDKVNNMANIDHSVLDLHAVLKAYYKVARKRFVDVMCMQVTDHHLMKGSDSPLRIFDPVFVSSLTPAQLEAIAGEDQASKRLRKSLKTEIKALTEGRKLLRG